MACTLHDLGFKGCLADPDVCFKHYEYVPVYAEDI